MKWAVRGELEQESECKPACVRLGRGRVGGAVVRTRMALGRAGAGVRGWWGLGLTREDGAPREALEGRPSPHPWPNGMALE